MQIKKTDSFSTTTTRTTTTSTSSDNFNIIDSRISVIEVIFQYLVNKEHFLYGFIYLMLYIDNKHTKAYKLWL
jgi:hypothetical protein